MSLGLVRAAQGRDEEAEELLRQAYDTVATTELRLIQCETLQALTQFLRDRGRGGEAAELDARREGLLAAVAVNVVETVKAAARRVLPASVHAELKGALRPETLVPTEELARVDRHALAHLRESAPPVGDYLEFGVFRGDSLLCMERARREAGLSFRLFGFYSF